MTEREHSTSPHRRTSWTKGVSALGAKFGIALTNVDENGNDLNSTKETDVSSLLTKAGDMEVESRGELSWPRFVDIMALEIREISTGTTRGCRSCHLISFHYMLSYLSPFRPTAIFFFFSPREGCLNEHHGGLTD